MAFIEPAQTQCNYLALFFPQPRERALGVRLGRHDARGSSRSPRHSCPTARRGRRRPRRMVPRPAPSRASRRAAEPGPGQLPALRPVPVHRRARPAAAAARPATSATSPAAGDRHRPGDADRTPSRRRGCCREMGRAWNVAGQSEPDRDRPAGRRDVLHLHQGAAVHPSLHGHGRGAQLEPARPGLAGADRRRDRRQGHLHRPVRPHRIWPWSRCRSTTPARRSTPTPRSPSGLGCSWRATSTFSSRPAHRRQRR